mmetsp:Transcript_29088/g.64074  ORF Transcript_29088/g.64074 Transcript_29088/m.64074 type:complete len:260 (+) Transcript_29088:676-1455(+)
MWHRCFFNSSSSRYGHRVPHAFSALMRTRRWLHLRIVVVQAVVQVVALHHRHRLRRQWWHYWKASSMSAAGSSVITSRGRISIRIMRVGTIGTVATAGTAGRTMDPSHPRHLHRRLHCHQRLLLLHQHRQLQHRCTASSPKSTRTRSTRPRMGRGRLPLPVTAAALTPAAAAAAALHRHDGPIRIPTNPPRHQLQSCPRRDMNSPTSGRSMSLPPLPPHPLLPQAHPQPQTRGDPPEMSGVGSITGITVRELGEGGGGG